MHKCKYLSNGFLFIIEIKKNSLIRFQRIGLWSQIMVHSRNLHIEIHQISIFEYSPSLRIISQGKLYLLLKLFIYLLLKYMLKLNCKFVDFEKDFVIWKYFHKIERNNQPHIKVKKVKASIWLVKQIKSIFSKN